MNQTNRYKMILFDLDDTLTNTTSTKEEVFKNLYQDIRELKQISIEKYLTAVKECREKYFNKLIHKGFNTYARIEFWMNVMKNLNIELSINSYTNIVNKYWEYSIKAIKLNPRVLNTLRTLSKKSMLLSIATEGDFISKVSKLINLKIEKFFKYLFTTEIVQEPKNTGKLFKYILDFTKIEPSKIIMVGDKLSEDIIPAKKLGIKTVLYTNSKKENNKFLNTSASDYVIEDFRKLLKII